MNPATLPATSFVAHTHGRDERESAGMTHRTYAATFEIEFCYEQSEIEGYERQPARNDRCLDGFRLDISCVAFVALTVPLILFALNHRTTTLRVHQLIANNALGAVTNLLFTTLW
jgi:hypothetical protein